MKKTFKLEGLECAHCATKIQEGVNKIEGVTSATVNFMTTKLIIEVEDHNMDTIIEAIKGIIKKLEPDVVLKKA